MTFAQVLQIPASTAAHVQAAVQSVFHLPVRPDTVRGQVAGGLTGAFARFFARALANASYAL